MENVLLLGFVYPHIQSSVKNITNPGEAR